MSRVVPRWMVLVAAGAVAVASGCAAKRSSAPVPPGVAAPETHRAPPAGELRGSVGRYGAHVWKGIPFAAPPVGERRWAAPQPLPRWEGVRQATIEGGYCPQYTSRFAGVEGESGSIVGTEDCLYLNVYAPPMSPAEVPSGEGRLPVMFWIHGGGNVIGHAGFYDGGRLAAEQALIVVTINYRLGPLGWFRHPALRVDGDVEANSGNFGILDQIRALEWVRDNIASFGGDPDRVTIFGESAGGRAVFGLLTSPRARGLFHRAISQSGGLRSNDPAAAEAWVEQGGDRNSSKEVLARLLVGDGRATDRAAARARAEGMGREATAAFLRAASAEALLAAYDTDAAEGLVRVPQMFPDGVVLADGDPLETLATPGGAAPVPVMMGTNRDEAKLFMFADPRFTKQFLGFLPRARDLDRFLALAEHRSNMWKAYGADEPADALRRGGREDVYVYRFDWDDQPRPLGTDLPTLVGAAHGFEIPFVFGHFDLGRAGNVIFSDANEAGREELGRQMRSYWSRFAATGDPGRGRDDQLPAWPASPTFLVFDSSADGGLRTSAETLTEEQVLDAVAADARLSETRHRCGVYRDLLQASLRHGEDEYMRRDAACVEFPFADDPWAR